MNETRNKHEKDEVQRILDKTLDEVSSLKSQLLELEKELYFTQTKFQLIESTQTNLPLPICLTDQDGVMTLLNDAYELFYLKPYGKTREDRIGKTVVEFLSEVNPALEDEAERSLQSDLDVYDTGGVYHEKEFILIGEVRKQVDVIKYLRSINGVKLGTACITWIGNKDLKELNNALNKLL